MTAEDKRIVESEYLISSYFYSHFYGVMNAEKSKLQHAQAKEMGEYALSFHGIMSALAAASNPSASLVDNSRTYLRVTGEYNSKTAEDYIELCKGVIAKNSSFQEDLTRLADEWRNAVVAKVGRERYDSVSEKLGCDLALAYVDNRIEQMMVDKMVRDQMPKSTVEYVIQKGVSNSLLGLSESVLQSPLEAEIEARGEAAYNPSGKEKLGARAVSLGADVASFGGVASWGSLARMAGCEVIFAGVDTYLEKNAQKPNVATVDQLISQAVFGSDKNILSAYRSESLKLKAYESEYIQGVNNSMKCRMNSIPKEKPMWEVPSFEAFSKPQASWGMTASAQTITPFQLTSVPQSSQPPKSEKPRNPDVPLVIAPGHEEEYLKWQAEYSKRKSESKTESAVTEAAPSQQESVAQPSAPEAGAGVAQPDANQTAKQSQQTNSDGWAGLLSSTGLSGLGDIGHNLGFVLSMLPELLLGVFTGDTKSLNRHNSLMPLASILLGVFVRNPMLKMMFIGFGGANLVNKVGHEALDRQNERLGVTPKTQFKQYDNEALNPRIVNPAISGNSLIATIDRVPCTITLTENVVQAYNSGALPINTLANAILDRHDRMQQLAEENYRNNQQSQDRIIIQR